MDLIQQQRILRSKQALHPEINEKERLERYEGTFLRRPYGPYNDKQDPRYYGRLFYDMKNRVYLAIGVTFVLGIAIPAVVLFLQGTDKGIDNYGNCLVDSKFRFQCDFNQVEDWYQSVYNCTNKGQSCWDAEVEDVQFRCYHSVPSGHQYFLAGDISTKNRNKGRNSPEAISADEVITMQLRPGKSYATDAMGYAAQLSWAAADVLSLDFYDPSIELPEITGSSQIKNATDIEINYPRRVGELFYLQIQRRSPNITTIFDTRLGPLRFSSRGITVSMALPSRHFYGIRGGQGVTETAMTVDAVATFGQNELPFFMVHENVSNFMHAVLIESSRPFVAQVINGPGISFHFEGNFGEESPVSLKFFLGPSPTDVLKQLSTYLQFKTSRHFSLPPYWSLGLHLCRKTNSSTSTLEKLLRLNGEASADPADPRTVIPYDSDCISENLRKPVKIDTNQFRDIKPIIQKLNATGKRVLLTQRLSVPKELADKLLDTDPDSRDMFILTSSSEDAAPFQGVVDKKPVNYLTALSKKAGEYIRAEFDSVGDFGGVVLIDGLRHDNASYERQKRRPENWNSRILSNFSSEPWGIVDPGAVHANVSFPAEWRSVSHLDVHNGYGHEALKLISEVINATVERVLVSTGTLAPASYAYGAYSGLDVKFTWDGLRESLSHFLRYFMFAPLGGIPIGGSFVDLPADVTIDQELCLRWYQVALLLPFARNTYGDENRNHSRGPLDLNRLYQRHLIQNIRDRYALNPYYYTLFYDFIETGVPPVVPVSIYDTSGSPDVTFKILDQFMIGPALMAAPIVYPGTLRSVYFPNDTWYTLDGEVAHKGAADSVTVSALVHHVPIYLRHGHIVPILMNPQGETTEETRRGNYTIVATYPCGTTFMGRLYLDDGVTIEPEEFQVITFSLTETEFQINVEGHMRADAGYQELSKVISEIRIFGVPRRPRFVASSVINGTLPSQSVTFDSGVLRLLDLNIDWGVHSQVTLSWETSLCY